MRYIRKEHLITTICNQEIEEEDIIKRLLSNLKDNSIEFSLDIKKYFPSLYDYKNIQYGKVRVKEVQENTVDFTVFDRGSITHLNNIDFSDVVEINAITTVNKILQIKPDVTRWDILDITEK